MYGTVENTSIADFFRSLFLLDSDSFEFIVDDEFLELLSNPKDGLIDARSRICVCRFLIGSFVSFCFKLSSEGFLSSLSELTFFLCVVISLSLSDSSLFLIRSYV